MIYDRIMCTRLDLTVYKFGVMFFYYIKNL